MSTLLEAPNNKINIMSVQNIMRQRFINYAMYVINHRALPDVRDGLKPVHRRILFSMFESGMVSSKAYKKSARMVGNVIGKYHPHGDTSVYEAAVLMAQPFSTNHPLIDGQGNFGSIDGDNPAAMRYTEMRLDKISSEFFKDLYKETVEWRENYDGSEIEPVTLPSSFPSLLVNGIDGIAVGMACNIPPHNLSSIIDATIALMDDEALDTLSLMSYLKAPDFPTEGLIYDLDGFANAIETGRGRVKLRSKWHEEERKRGSKIVIDELPYQVNKSTLIGKIAELVKNKIIEDIIGIRDESNKKGIRIVIDLRQEGSAEVIFAQLCKMTQMEVSINYNCVVIDQGEPKLLGLKDILLKWISFRRATILKRCLFDKKKAVAQLHLFEGLTKAIGDLDKVITFIRNSKSAAHAKPGLMELLLIDEIQAQAILDMRLQKITGMELDKIKAEHDSISQTIVELDEKINDSELLNQEIKAELKSVQTKYGAERKTEIGYGITALEREDLIPQEDVLITMTRGGYIKRMPVSVIDVQNRGTRGKRAVTINDEDEVRAMYQVNSHDMLLVFGCSGQIYGSKAYNIPPAKLTDKGRHIKNVIEGFDEEIKTVLAIPIDKPDTASVVSLTRKGIVKRSGLANYSGSTRKGGVIGMNMSSDDGLFGAYTCQDGDTMIIVGSSGRAVHFEVDKLRMASRTSGGVTGIKLKNDEYVVGAYIIKQSQSVDDIYLACIGEKGIGKRTLIKEFGVKGRGGKGMASFKITPKTGVLASAFGVKEDQDIVMFASNGVSNKISVSDISINGRATSGAKLMNLDEGEKIISVTPSVKSAESTIENVINASDDQLLD